MSARPLDEALAALPLERRPEAEARVRQVILEEARQAFHEAAIRCCHDLRNAPPSEGSLGDMRRAYDRMLLAFRESPEAERERARIDQLLGDRR